MRPVRASVLVLTFSLLAACTTPSATTPPPAPADATHTATVASEPAAPKAHPLVARIKLFALSDFHGHLEPLEPKNYDKYFGGLANVAGTMVHRDALHPSNSILVDNGDMWTGPSVSTFLRGEPVIAAYNAMGMTAANIANHEFDFGQEVLRARITEAKFPFLGANIVKSGSDEQPGFLKPFIVVERDGVKVGLIGLSYLGTPETTLAKHVAGLEFKPYGETLERVVPAARAAGAEVIVVLFHDTLDNVKTTLEAHANLGISAVIAGQNHRKGNELVGDTVVVNPGPFGRSYARFDIEVDRKTRAVSSVKIEIVDVLGKPGQPAFPPSADLTAIAEAAKQKSKSLSSTVIGKISGPLPVGSFADSPLGHLVTDSWLAAFPEVDVAICNHGALREPLAKGDVTMGDITSVLPFENNLYIVELTGKQLKSQLVIDHPVVSGITWRFKEKDGKRTVLAVSDRSSRPINDKKKYKVVINDFMYTGGDGYQFEQLDSTPDDTGLSPREPIMRMFRLAQSAGREVDPPVGPRAAKGR